GRPSAPSQTSGPGPRRTSLTGAGASFGGRSGPLARGARRAGVQPRPLLETVMPEPTQRHTADATGPVTLAERLLTLPLRLREFSRVEDLVPAAALALATELGARARVRWAGAESSTGAGGSATPASGSAVVRLDLRERGDVIASLEIERETPFTAEERRLLAHLSASLDEHVTELSERLETRLQAALSTTLAASEDLEDAAARVARTLHEH